MKRVDIKTGFVCNNNCLFCVQADNKLKGMRTFEDILTDLNYGREKGCNEIVLTGGEVTIRKDFFDILEKAREMGYNIIQIQTNGRMLSYENFCKKAIECGLNSVAVALHGCCSEQHDSLTRAPGSFDQTKNAIRNLSISDIPFVVVVVVVKQNYKSLPDIMRMLIKLKVTNFHLALVHPMGNALKNFAEVVPKLEEVAPFIKEAINLAKENKRKIMIEAMPFCLMSGYESFVCEQYSADTIIRGVGSQNTDNFEEDRKKMGKFKPSECKNCEKYSVCEGPWKEYFEAWGAEFIPKKSGE